FTFASNFKLLDYGSTVGPGSATHALTLYRHPSGALVFSAGTIQWTWGLDVNHDRAVGGATPDLRMQQATLNLLADMGAQPPTRPPTGPTTGCRPRPARPRSRPGPSTTAAASSPSPPSPAWP